MILFIISLLVSLLVSVLVYVNNPRNRTARALLLLILFVNLWLFFVQFAIDIDRSSVWVVRATFISAITASYLCYPLQKSFTNYEYVKLRLALLILTGFAIVFSMSEFVVSAVKEVEGQIDIDRGLLYPFVVFTLLLNVSVSLYLLFVAHRTTTGIRRGQIGMVILALFFAGACGVVTNIFLPALDFSDVTYRFSPVSSIALTGMISYAILRHKFLDVRLIVARSIAYFLSLLIIGVLFLSLTYTALFLLFDETISASQQVTFFSLSLFLAVVFRPLKTYFDKATDRLFYQDNYDVQEQIDHLSEVVVSEYQIDNLVTSSLLLLSQSLRPSTGKIILLDGHGEYYDEYKLQRAPRINGSDAIRHLTIQTETILIPDEYDDFDQQHSSKQKLIQYLKKHDVALSVRLSTKDEIVGFMLFGSKLSGNLYNTKDRQFTNTAAKELAIAIQNARRFDEIQRFNETLKLEIERATAELRKSNEKLQQLDQAKDEFITMASHQLRTPLTSVKGYVSMVMEGDAGKITPKQKELLFAAFSSSQRMVYLISDLLNVSRLRTGKFLIDPSKVYLPAIVDTEIEQLKETARSRDIKIVFKHPKNFPEVMLDDTKTRQVIMNFIDNAIYYTQNGGRIVVDLNVTARKLEFSVKDNGIGVPKKEQHNLFTKFYRAGNARKARPDGTGLGLFMAKKVIIDQGGAVIFHSTEGKGSTFGFSFPLSKIVVKEAKKPKSKTKQTTK